MPIINDILAKNLLILASAGSGKTYQLANRVIGLIARGVEPERIVALTFTRKAAGEFTDSVLTKLASAADCAAAASTLDADLGGAHQHSYDRLLRKMVQAMPKLMFGTMDGFFAKVLRGFQYEMGLTGGRFELLQGPREAKAIDSLLSEILAHRLSGDGADEFYYQFRRTVIGRESQVVMEPLRHHVLAWFGLYRLDTELKWGVDETIDVSVWEQAKHALAEKARRGVSAVEETRKGQIAKLNESIDALAKHQIGSGSLANAGSLTTSILEAVAAGGPLKVKFFREFLITGPTADAIREMAILAAQCEAAAANRRTIALHSLLAHFDRLHEVRLRGRGLLSFNDVKFLMGAWAGGEEARLRREAVDFRLDARYDHWLLDEFQDTSPQDWRGLQPLIDEAAGADPSEGSVFIVGDTKQAIYGWRGGDVRLFGEVQQRYQPYGLVCEHMDRSFRSSEAVLELVNRVCTDQASLEKLFEDSANLWDCDVHGSAHPGRSGESRVEVVLPEARDERLIELLHELQVGERDLSCGILLRTRADVAAISELLRHHDFDVVEEGNRKPAHDNPVGVALSQIVQWLGDSANRFAQEVIAMSPFKRVLEQRYGSTWQAAWEGLTGRAADVGFGEMLRELASDCPTIRSEFGKSRANDLIRAMSEFDASGGVHPLDAADWLRRLEISQSPGDAAVQVMTIHKSKGLGFDLVIVPEIPEDLVPQTERFTQALFDGRVSQVPPSWARALLPDFQQAEEAWRKKERYEAFCTVYVALTRAKRGLYVLLNQPKASADLDKPSLANWLRHSLGVTEGLGIAFQTGEASWVEQMPQLSSIARPLNERRLPASAPRRARVSPSSLAPTTTVPIPLTSRGASFGTTVHALFERIGWIDEEPYELPDDDAGVLVQSVLATPSLHSLFERKGRAIELLREQPVDVIHQDKWISGTIDRLHLERNTQGEIIRIVVLDFKTDTISSADALRERHVRQMNCYRDALNKIFPTAEIECLLISTHLRCPVRVAPALHAL